MPPDKIARRIASRPRSGAVQISDSSSRILAGLLEARTGQQLTLSRRWRIETALVGAAARARHRHARRADHHPGHGQGAELVADGWSKALLNNETYFFRDRAPFDLLASAMRCPSLPSGAPRRKRIRIWSAGCSTGQEVYSLAMLFAEDPETWRGWTIDILGTDVSTACVDRARLGTYSQFEVQRGLGINQMIKWFEECADGWRAAEALRKPVRFQVHNLLEPPPHPGGFDIVLCRNVLLYLSADKKALAFERLSSAMAEDGWLMLGAGETVIGQTSRLGADINARGLYRLTERRRARSRSASGDRRAAAGGA